MRNDPAVFIEHVLYSKGKTKEDFFNSVQLQDSIIRRIEIIGEAVKNPPEDFRDSHQEIPWQEIAGMRDILIHEYFGIELELTWEVAKTDIPDLKRKLSRIKEELK